MKREFNVVIERDAEGFYTSCKGQESVILCNCECMKNITISLDNELYRKTRIKAAELDTSVSALVRKHLVSIAGEPPAPRDLKQEQEALLDSIRQRHPGFTSADNLYRDDLHDRNALR